MKLLILGSTGMLGRSLLAAAKRRGLDAVGVARKGADLDFDVTDLASLRKLLASENPSAIINCVAITDINVCESNPAEAHRVNSELPRHLTASAPQARIVQISTDHFFSGGGAAKHAEDSEVKLVNEYARSKFAGEEICSTHANALAIRTNIIGFRGWQGRPTFLEWAVGAIEREEKISGFTDYFTSPIDTAALAEMTLDLAALPVRGILNVASSEVSNKYAFLKRLAAALGRSDAPIGEGSVRALPVRRAESAGLDAARAEALLQRRMPALDEVIASALRQRAS